MAGDFGKVRRVKILCVGIGAAGSLGPCGGRAADDRAAAGCRVRLFRPPLREGAVGGRALGAAGGPPPEVPEAVPQKPRRVLPRPTQTRLPRRRQTQRRTPTDPPQRLQRTLVVAGGPSGGAGGGAAEYGGGVSGSLAIEEGALLSVDKLRLQVRE